MLEFVVDGDPVPQGSMSAIPRHKPCTRCLPGKPCGRKSICISGREIFASVVHGNDELTTWRYMVALGAKLALNRASLMRRPAFDSGGVVLAAVFKLTRPKDHFTTKGALSAEGLRHPVPAKKPDGDKLLRAVQDALSYQEEIKEGMYRDDAQVIASIPWKAWAPNNARQGSVTILVEPVGDSDVEAAHRIVTRAMAIVAATKPSTGDLFK